MSFFFYVKPTFSAEICTGPLDGRLMKLLQSNCVKSTQNIHFANIDKMSVIFAVIYGGVGRELQMGIMFNVLWLPH